MLLVANIVLFFHLLVVIFITSGFVLVPIGYKLNWGWVANIKLRILHCGMMAFITLETLLGVTCPLTSIEHYFRGIHQSESFVVYWITKTIYWDLPSHFFIILYCICLGWTFLMWKLFPPSN